ncbi:TraB/GumN family protein [Pontibacter ramchanderi]|uniref:TraB family protein n=1 Tax=Pontibacter ramchanderi TaxID=1179743 RepID=A0A2N3UB14_9BACT|nr:TraB/GumN family protein [Pontibacter ramchanderi]PKV66566.1 hypothetical protein BD749_1695 [Pontibacter ramchanderi]
MNYKNKIASLCILLVALLLSPTLSQAQKVKSKPAKAKTTAQAPSTATTKSLLWEVSGNGLKQPSYLYGTYHLLNASFLNTVPEVMERFMESRGLVVETVIDSAKMMQLGTLMVMPNNKLSNLLTKEDYALVNQEVKEQFGFELSMADQMKPMTLLLMLSLKEYQRVEALKNYTGEPMDGYFANYNKKSQKKVSTLETMEQQFGFLYNHHPLDKQAEQLVAYIKNKDAAMQLSNKLVELYLQKDLPGIWALTQEYNELTGGGDMAYMTDDRNKDWMTKLPAIMKEQSTFIAVGAAHLPGENGLLQLLQRAGYTVKPLQ